MHTGRNSGHLKGDFRRIQVATGFEWQMFIERGARRVDAARLQHGLQTGNLLSTFEFQPGRPGLNFNFRLMKRLFICAIIGLFPVSILSQTYQLSSPDRRTMITIEVGDGIRYSIQYDDKQIVLPSPVNMLLQENSLAASPVVIKKYTRQVNEEIIPEVPEKRKFIRDQFNELTLKFRKPFSLIFRAYDDGIAYRFQTRFPDSIVVQNEIARINFPQNHPVYFTAVVPREGTDSFHTSFEEPYQYKTLDSIGQAELIFSPLLVAPVAGPKLLVTESDIEDYPGMFLTGRNNRSLEGKFAPYPLEEIMTTGEFPQYIVSKRAGFIARTKGSRVFPWRVIAIANKDTELPSNDIVYRLASPSRIGNTDWVKPGQCTDEWIIGINIFNVPFKSGINTATYKYYIDFARKFGIERIMMDAGWSDYKDLFKINPALDMNEIAAYAREQGVKLSMWTLALTLDRQLEPALEQFKKWGVDFIMTDFMDRDDQKMMNFYYRIAEACARHRIMVMFHGAFKPAGFGRTFPSAITREGVLGSEYNIWSDKATPKHNVLLPFIRMVSGPMDYEPGILDNATQKTFRPIGDKVMAAGTRCHQLAMFVVYESPIQVFSGNPAVGLLEPAFMELLGGIPTTWDETIIPEGQVGEYIVTARKKGNDWYIAGMTNWTARDLVLSLDFLGEGNFEFTRCEDGVNADRYPSDYSISSGNINAAQQLNLHMAPGGGFLLKLKKK